MEIFSSIELKAYDYSLRSILLVFRAPPPVDVSTYLKEVIHAKYGKSFTLNEVKGIKGWICPKKNKEEIEVLMEEYKGPRYNPQSSNGSLPSKDTSSSEVHHPSQDTSELEGFLEVSELKDETLPICTLALKEGDEVRSRESIKSVGKALLSMYGLDGWKIRVNDDVSSRGRCLRYKKVITVSTSFNHMGEEENYVVNTVLHQISHALTPGEDHSPKWRKIATSIGYKGKACSRYRDDGRYKYELKCSCERIIIESEIISGALVESYICNQCSSGLEE